MISEGSADLHPIVGIVGGMGPRSTVLLYKMIVERLQSANLSAHILINHVSTSNIFDGEAAILGKMFQEEVQRLEAAGATRIGIACNSAHKYFSQMRQILTNQKTILFDLVDETSSAFGKRGHKRAGVLATRAAAPLYFAALQRFGVEGVLPDASSQAMLDDIVRGILAGRATEQLAQALSDISGDLVTQGAEGIILGCTDLPLISDAVDFSGPVVSSLDVLIGVLFPSLVPPPFGS